MKQQLYKNPPVGENFVFIKKWTPARMQQGMVAKVLSWGLLSKREKSYYCNYYDFFRGKLPFRFYRTKATTKTGLRSTSGPLWKEEKKEFWESVVCEKHFNLSEVVLKDDTK